MGIIQEVEAVVSIIPRIEKVVADAKAAEQTPQVQQLITDLEEVVAAIKGAVGTPPPAPAA